jgi:hypothetical protein
MERLGSESHSAVDLGVSQSRRRGACRPELPSGQVFGWMKTIGGLRHRGGELVDWIVTFTAAAYDVIRLRTLLARPA